MIANRQKNDRIIRRMKVLRGWKNLACEEKERAILGVDDEVQGDNEGQFKGKRE